MNTRPTDPFDEDYDAPPDSEGEERVSGPKGVKGVKTSDDSGRSATGGFSLEDMLSDQRHGRSILRGPAAIAGAVVASVLITAYLYFSDDNSDRWELRCTRGEAEARRGLYFPWGTRRIADDAHDRLLLPEGVSCASVSLESLQELDETFGGLLLEAAEHRLQQGGPEALAEARQDVERAHRLRGLSDEQRRRAEALLADMAYHEARELLRQVERNLMQARRKLERAQSLGAGSRFGDLEEWLRFVQKATERFSPASEDDAGEPPSPQEETTPTEPTPSRIKTPELPVPPPADVFL